MVDKLDENKKPVSSILSGYEKELKEKIAEDLKNKPKEQPQFALTLIHADQDKKHAKILIPHPPTAIIVAKNKEKVYQFSQLQITPEGPIFVYTEISALLFDIHLPPEGVSHEPH